MSIARERSIPLYSMKMIITRARSNVQTQKGIHMIVITHVKVVVQYIGTPTVEINLERNILQYNIKKILTTVRLAS